VPKYRRSLSLTSANAGRIRAAIQSLRNRTRHAAAAPRPPADLIELHLRVDGLVADIAKSIRVLNPLESRNPRRDLLAYAANKLRALT
jgi:hypothetical protein